MPAKLNACPICGQPTVLSVTPFCSQGCKDRDLLNWLGEAYASPVRPDEDDLASSGLDNLAHD